MVTRNTFLFNEFPIRKTPQESPLPRDVPCQCRNSGSFLTRRILTLTTGLGHPSASRSRTEHCAAKIDRRTTISPYKRPRDRELKLCRLRAFFRVWATPAVSLYPEESCSRVLVPNRIGGADLRHCFRNAAQVRLWTAFRGFVCEICARSERLVSALCRAEAGRAATFPISFRLNFPRLCRNTVRTPANARIAKHALIRSGLADAGSAIQTFEGNLARTRV